MCCGLISRQAVGKRIPKSGKEASSHERVLLFAFRMPLLYIISFCSSFLQSQIPTPLMPPAAPLPLLPRTTGSARRPQDTGRYHPGSASPGFRRPALSQRPVRPESGPQRFCVFAPPPVRRRRRRGIRPTAAGSPSMVPSNFRQPVRPQK